MGINGYSSAAWPYYAPKVAYTPEGFAYLTWVKHMIKAPEPRPNRSWREFLPIPDKVKRNQIKSSIATDPIKRAAVIGALIGSYLGLALFGLRGLIANAIFGAICGAGFMWLKSEPVALSAIQSEQID